MAKYLYAGVKRTYAKAKVILNNAESLYQAAFQKQYSASQSYDQLSKQALEAETEANSAIFQLDMYQAELTAAVKGIAGLGSTTPPGS
ncbi:MAG: hypothetical protein R3B93_14880 [Bacteroidia bacterium]